MRILIDLQAAQGQHRYEHGGITALALAQALARQRGPHELLLALNGMLPEAIEPIRAAFDASIGQSRIHVWYGMPGLAINNDGDEVQRALTESLRATFFDNLAVDVVLVMDVFQGFDDDAAVSIGDDALRAPTAALVDDLRPLRAPDLLLAPTSGLQAYYRRQADHLSRAALLLTLSAQGVADAAELLGRPALDIGAGASALPGAAYWDQVALKVIDVLGDLCRKSGPATVQEGALAPVAAMAARLSELPASPTAAQLRLLAHLLSRFPQQHQVSQIFVDISELVQRDARTGVQRVTRSILRELLEQPPDGYTVAPVYCTEHSVGYRYAHRFVADLLGVPARGDDSPIDYQADDIFLGLDLLPQFLPQKQVFLQRLRADGVKILFVVYDLLPVLMPAYFPAGTDKGHARWLHAVTSFDGAICISRAVAVELSEWLQEHQPDRLRPFMIGWFHLGADVANSVPSKGLPDNADQVLHILRRCPTLISVGTVEPRKQYGQALDGFELMWAQGVEVNLVIVGKQGWMVEALAERLRTHPQQGRHLFWLEGISDEYLSMVYEAADGLLAASAGEGFGLPLIEAAQYGKPIIARDLPVFREVGADHAFYFSGDAPQDLATAVREWLQMRASARAPSTAIMPYLRWSESAAQLMQVVLAQPGYEARLVAPRPAVHALRPRVLSLATYPVRQPRHGGQLRVAAMNRVYEAAGFDVHFVGFYQVEAYEPADIGPYDIAFPSDSPHRNHIGIAMPALSDFLMGPFAMGSEGLFRKLVDTLPGNIDVIQVEQPWLFALALRLKQETRLCRDALLVNSSHNIEAHMKRAILKPLHSQAVIDHVVTDMSRIEMALAREADLSLAVTTGDAAVLESYGAATVVVAPNGISPWIDDKQRQQKWRAILPAQPWPIFIASAHPPNFTGFIDAIGSTLDCIPEGAKLVICGGVGPILERELAKSPERERNLARLQVLGVLDDADLAAVKSLAHTFLLPIGAGGGSNIKTAEALYSGKPVICTTTALRGFEHFADLPEVSIADTPEQFQAAIRLVLGTESRSVDPASTALRASLTWDACLAQVPAEVRALLQQKENHA